MAEGTFPKSDGEIFYASEANKFRTTATFISGGVATEYIATSGTTQYPTTTGSDTHALVSQRCFPLFVSGTYQAKSAGAGEQMNWRVLVNGTIVQSGADNGLGDTYATQSFAGNMTTISTVLNNTGSYSVGMQIDFNEGTTGSVFVSGIRFELSYLNIEGY